MAKVNKTKYALLGVLSFGAGSGYDIKKFCDSSIGHFWNENYGHIYPMLKKMEEEELITKEVEQTEGRPAKNVYSITEKGKKELNEWLLLPAEQEPIRSEFLLKMFCSKDLPVENVIEKLEKLKKDCENELEEYVTIKNILVNSKEMGKKILVLSISTVTFGIYNTESKIKWCEDTIENLKKIEAL